jgi:predicted dienelactone hydrolase
LFSILLAALTLSAGAVGAATPSDNIGFEIRTIAPPGGPPMQIGIWYPTTAAASPQRLGGWTQVVAPDAEPAAGPHPMVVFSHGNGGWFAGHYDTAEALAHAGFVVAALTHPGDNYEDKTRQTDMPDRPRDLHRLIDYMVADWRGRDSVDAGRIGAFGFSAGGFTVLAAAGGAPDFSLIKPHCEAKPADFDCVVTRQAGKLGLAATPASAFVHDPRIKAVVAAAPALGFTFETGGLKGVTIPVQIWRAEYDHVLPSPDYAEAARDALPTLPDYHVVKNADHFDFLAPCDAGLATRIPEICTSRPGFDRGQFHQDFDAAVVAFFDKTIG